MNPYGNVTHGLSGGVEKARLYRIWKQMRQRCRNPNDQAYSRYGGAGITIAPEWDDYPTFHAWALANGYRDDLTIDRIDNELGYTPNNCRWATYAAQNRNRRMVKRLEHRGKVKTAREWARLTGIRYRTILSRLRLGWSVERALTTPTRGVRRGTDS